MPNILSAIQRPDDGADGELTELWPFTKDAPRRLADAVRAGNMSPNERSRLEELATKGFVIFERCVEPELVDALVRDVRSIGEHPGCFITTDHRHGRAYRYSDETFDAFESAFDLYVNFESARRVCFHPTIGRFLRVAFDTEPLAFQQLLFQRSNQHPAHQDTAYVCLEEPLQMLATWIALEDVVPGRGELTYYEGSHRIAHHFFRDGSKRFSQGSDDPEEARRHILAECARLGCEKRDFIAKKGDVLLWAADLVHGSNPRTRPEEETRMSLVTHYCPITNRPFFFRFHPGNRGIARHGDTFTASYYYRLPVSGDMGRPNFRIP